MSGACESSVSSTPGQCQPSPWEPHPHTVSLFPLPEWVCRGAQWDQSIPSPHCPPITITVEGSGAGRGQRVPRSPFHPSTSGPFPPFVTQFGSITPALAPGHVLGSEVMDSAAGEISPVGRGVGGLLARFHGVGRARGFLSQHPSRHPVQGPPSSRFALLPGSLSGC